MADLFAQARLKSLALLSAAVLVVQVVLSKWVYPLFGASTQSIFSISPQTALQSTAIGDKILGVISGVVPINLGSLMTWVSMFVGVFVLLIAGYWAYDQGWAWKGKNIYQRLWAILLYGTAVLYVVLLVTKSGTLSTIAFPLLIGLGINYFVVAFVVSQLASRLNFLRI